MRLPVMLLAAAAVAGSAVGAVGQDAHTTRIETRPYYGAVVTIEHGVRVTRPLPPDQHVIINPYGSTPVVVGQSAGVVVAPQGASGGNQ